MSDNPDLEIEIHNVVATASFGQQFNLVDIFKHFRDVEYRPKRFHVLVFKLKTTKTTTLIFRTGKMVCTGAKSVKTTRSAVRKVAREFKMNGIIVFE